MKFKKSLTELIITFIIFIGVAVGLYFLIDDILRIGFRVIKLFLPFIAAYVISLAVNPLVHKLEKKIKLPRNVSTIIVILLTIGILGGILFAIGWKIVAELQSLYSQFPVIAEDAKNMWEYISSHFSQVYSSLPESMKDFSMELGDGVVRTASSILKNSSMPVVYGIGNVAKSLPKIFIWIIVFILSLFFMVSDSYRIKHFMGKCCTKRFWIKIRRVQRYIRKYLGGYIKAQLIIMSVASIIILIGLSILDVNYALLIALGIAILDALPFFGSGAVLWPWTIISFINGDIKNGIGLIIIYLAVIFTRQMIEPKIVSESIGIHPVLTLMSMYLGFKLFSIGGMILGPMTLILIVSFYKAGAFDGVIAITKNFGKKLYGNIKDIYEYFN